MFLFFKGFQPETDLNLFLFFVKYSSLFLTKIIPGVNNSQ